MKNIASVLLLLGAGQGIFFSLIILGISQNKNRANKWLALFIFFFSVCMLGTVLYDQKIVVNFPHLAQLSSPFGTAMGFTLFLYVRALTENKYQFVNWEWMHILPVIVSIAILSPFYFMPYEEKKEMIIDSYHGFPLIWKVNFIFSSVMNTIYLIATSIKVARNERLITKLYSNTENKSLIWVRHFILAGVTVFFLCILMSIFDIAAADTISNVMFSIVIYIMGYRAIKQPEVFEKFEYQDIKIEDNPALVKLPMKYEKSGLTEEKASLLLEKLEKLMTRDKLYLDPELSLQQLSIELGTTTHQTSQLLNQMIKLSFFDYVNGLRVEHFKLLVNDPHKAHLSLLGLAYESGFNSKAAFHATVKKLTGHSPSALKLKTNVL